MSDPYEYGGADELVSNDWPVPFTMVPVWLLLAGCTAQAYRMYAFLAAHIQSSQKKPGERIVCPKQVAIAHVMGLKNPRQVGAYGRELERLGALKIKEYRYAGDMRRGYRYVVRFSPPEGYAGPVSLTDLYEANQALKFAPSPGRVRAAVTPDGGAENSTAGGTKNSTTGGAENSTVRGTPHSTAHGPTDGTVRGTPSSSTDGAAHGRAHGPENSTAKLEVGERDVWERETPPPPPPVPTAEDARGRTSEEGPATPDDLSPATAGGAAGPSPTGGPAVAKSAATTKAVDRMAADVVRTLPRVLQPANDDERGAIHWLIADKLAVGYPVGVVRQALNADPPDHVKVKTAFISHRLDQMAPWVPGARPASDTAAVDEIRGRESIRAGDEQQRARREEIRLQVQAQKAQRQGKSGSEDGS